jgi:predicted RNA-binding Zn ribbon-like protein
MNTAQAPSRLSPTPQLLGGALCLDFANTVDAGRTASPRERLFGYDDLLTWARHAGVLTDDEVEAARCRAAADEVGATVAFQRAIALRESIYRTFEALADGGQPTGVDLERLQRAYLDALAAARLVQEDGRFDWSWGDAEAGALDRVLWPIARSAVEVLAGAEIGRVKTCASGTCRWLFVDGSKNASRRWCSMEDCGSRAKMRRQYARRRRGVRSSTA